MGGGGKGGGGGGGSEAIAREQARIARQLLGETRGLRHGVIGELENVLGFPATNFSTSPASGDPKGAIRSFGGGQQAGGQLGGDIGQGFSPTSPADIQAMEPFLANIPHKQRARLMRNPQALQGALGNTGFSSQQAQAVPQVAGPGPAGGGGTAGGSQASSIFSGVFRPARESLEEQFANARESILSSVPARGGQMNQLLSDVALGRAQAVGGLESELLGRAFDTAVSIGTRTPQQSLGGLGSAAALLGSAEAQQAQANAAKGSAIGTLGGAAIGGAFGGPAGAKGGAALGGTAVGGPGAARSLPGINPFTGTA